MAAQRIARQMQMAALALSEAAASPLRRRRAAPAEAGCPTAAARATCSRPALQPSTTLPEAATQCFPVGPATPRYYLSLAGAARLEVAYWCLTAAAIAERYRAGSQAAARQPVPEAAPLRRSQAAAAKLWLSPAVTAAADRLTAAGHPPKTAAAPMMTSRCQELAAARPLLSAQIRPVRVAAPRPMLAALPELAAGKWRAREESLHRTVPAQAVVAAARCPPLAMLRVLEVGEQAAREESWG